VSDSGHDPSLSDERTFQSQAGTSTFDSLSFSHLK
jgi:hypothetical protein